MHNLHSAKLTPQEFVSATSLSRRRSALSMRASGYFGESGYHLVAGGSNTNTAAAAGVGSATAPNTAGSTAGTPTGSPTIAASRKISTASNLVGGAFGNVHVCSMDPCIALMPIERWSYWCVLSW
jgi:hypothetical protein